MKIEYLQKIIARVQNQIHCPKCKSQFEESQIEMQAVKGNQVEFSAQCSKCEARSQICAEISGPNVPKARKIAAPKARPASATLELPATALNNDQIGGLKDRLKNFSGDDVNALFDQ